MEKALADRDTCVCRIGHVGLVRQNRRVIDDVSLDIHPHDFIALVGSNGSGKTTLLRLLLGFLSPTSGTIELFPRSGYDVRRLRSHIGYVPQTSHIDYKMPMSVRDVVAMGRYGLMGVGKRLTRDDHRIVDEAMNDVGIARLADRPIGHLSGGEYQKVQLARALCQTPDLLLLDEPTSNLDLGAQKECLDLIMRLHENHGLTTVIVMHDLKSLPSTCNRAVILDTGKIAYDGPFGDVFTKDNLAHIYKNLDDAILREILDELSTVGDVT